MIASTAMEEINLGIARRQLRLAEAARARARRPARARCSPTPTTAATPRSRAASSTTERSFPSSYRRRLLLRRLRPELDQGPEVRRQRQPSPARSTSSRPTGAPTAPTGTSSTSHEGPDGALYYLDLGYSDIGGDSRREQDPPDQVRAIEPSSGGRMRSANPTSGPAPLNVSFSSSGSSDPEGQPLTYSWNFGDGATSTAANPSHTYTTPGTYQVALDGLGRRQHFDFAPRSRSASVSVPTATISSPTDGMQFQAGDVISYRGDGTDPDDGSLPDSAFTWNIDFLHDGHVHPGDADHRRTQRQLHDPDDGPRLQRQYALSHHLDRA